MGTKSINHAAAWVSAIVFFIWNAVWFTLFGNQWLAFIGKTKADMNPAGPVPYIVAFIVALVIGYGSAIALADSDNPTAAHGISFALFMGIVFFAGPFLTGILFEGRPLGLWVLVAAGQLIGFALVGAIVGGWRKRAPVTS